MSGEAKRELSSGRVAHHHNSGGIEVVTLGDLGQETIGVCDVFECARPSSAGISNTAVFNIPSSESFCSQLSAEMASMPQIVFRAPKAPMDIHYYSGRFFTFGFTFGKTKLSELIGVLAVGEACVGWRRG